MVPEVGPFLTLDEYHAHGQVFVQPWAYAHPNVQMKSSMANGSSSSPILPQRPLNMPTTPIHTPYNMPQLTVPPVVVPASSPAHTPRGVTEINTQVDQEQKLRYVFAKLDHGHKNVIEW
eukprot:gene6795-16586_t